MADRMKESVRTAYSESRKVCILAHTENMQLEWSTFPAELNNNCYVRYGCECLTISTCFFEGLCECCYMKQIFNSRIFVKKLFNKNHIHEWRVLGTEIVRASRTLWISMWNNVEEDVEVGDTSACSERERNNCLVQRVGMLVASSLRDSVAMLLIGTSFLSSSESRERSDSVWSELFRHSLHLYRTYTHSSTTVPARQRRNFHWNLLHFHIVSYVGLDILWNLQIIAIVICFYTPE
jgi:hypothetical protein